MNAIRLTKSQQFWPLTEFIGGFGVPVGRYIERHRIPEKMLVTPELYIDEVRFWRLAGDLAEREGLQQDLAMGPKYWKLLSPRAN